MLFSARSQMPSASSSARTVGSGTTLKTIPGTSPGACVPGRIARQHQRLVARETRDLESAAGGRPSRGALARQRRPLGHHAHRRHLQRRRIRPLGRHHDCRVVGRGDRGELPQADTLGRNAGGVENRIVCIFDVARGERPPVAETQAAAQMENQRGRRRPLEAFGQVAEELSMRIEPDQRIEDQFAGARGNRVGRKPRVERDGRGFEINLEIARRNRQRRAMAAANRPDERGGDERNHHGHTAKSEDRTRPGRLPARRLAHRVRRDNSTSAARVSRRR